MEFKSNVIVMKPPSDTPRPSRWDEVDALCFPGVDKEVEDQRAKLNLPPYLFVQGRFGPHVPAITTNNIYDTIIFDEEMISLDSEMEKIGESASGLSPRALSPQPSPRETPVIHSIPTIYEEQALDINTVSGKSKTTLDIPDKQQLAPSPSYQKGISLPASAFASIMAQVREEDRLAATRQPLTARNTISPNTLAVPIVAATPSSGSSDTSVHKRSVSDGAGGLKGVVNMGAALAAAKKRIGDQPTAEFLRAAKVGDTVYIQKALSEAKVNPNAQNDEGQTALYLAVANKQIEVIKLLLAHPLLDLNIKDIVGHAPLHVAAKLGRPRQPDVLERITIKRELQLIQQENSRANKSVANQPMPPPDKDAEEDDLVVEIIRLLIVDKRIDINSKDMSFQSSLIIACAVGHLRVVYTLIRGGVAVNTETMTHVTPLHTAAEKGFTEIVKLLLSQSARIDAKDFRGYTPLHLAAQGNFADICRILKTAGANVSAELVGSRKTPVDLTTSDAVRHILLDMKTSMSHPLQVDFIRVKYDGNNPLQVIDHLGMSMCPGRSKKDHRRDLASDLNTLKKNKVNVLVTLVQQSELDMMGMPDFFKQVKNAGIEAIHYPIPDKWIPASMEDVSGLVYAIINRLNAGKTVVVHCNGGKGRTGLVVVSVLVALGMEPSEATDLVRLTRPGTLYNPAQQLYVRALRRFRDDQLNGRV